MIVTDTSVLVNLLAGTTPEVRAARRALDADTSWIAPSHWLAETFHALRGLALGGTLSGTRSVAAIGALRSFRVFTMPIDELIPEMWRLRHNFSGYDAAYVVLAQVQDVTLVTADRRLARAAADHCRVRLTRPPSPS